MDLPFTSEDSNKTSRFIQGLHFPLRNIHAKRICIFALALITVFVFLTLATLTWHSNGYSSLPNLFSTSTSNIPEFPSALKGPPTSAFQDNLRSDLQYITTWPSAGWSNDVMTYANLMYLAIITQRIPVLPHFTPSAHVHGASISAGEIFDLGRLSDSIGLPVLEWKDVKASNSSSVDTLDCWNLWEVVSDSHSPFGSPAPHDLGLNLSYTKAPSWVRHRPDDGANANHVEFWSLARLTFGDALAEINGHAVPPPQMACFDEMYFICANQIGEYDRDYSPSWRFVARYMYWQPALQSLALGYARQEMGVSTLQPMPPWITIHARHGDFGIYCGDHPPSGCFAPLTAIARRVQEIKDELKRTRGVEVEHVFMTSDEGDEEWWKDVASFGWLKLDHAEIQAKYGPWYPVIVDAVIQSMALGFVGTAQSTMSLLAMRRVATWHGGVTRTVEWGFPGADDHE